MTFSIAAVDQRTGEVGVAVSSSSPAVAARCAHIRPGVGAACSQNITDPRLGTRLLDAVERGQSPEQALASVVNDPSSLSSYRQLTIVARHGSATACAHSGENTLGLYATAISSNAVAAGNLLATDAVPSAMLRAFDGAASEPLGERLMRALEAGLIAGGEAGPVRSAGLLVGGPVAWAVTDLRVDWHDEPIAALRSLWELWQPQANDYVTRALDPASSPSYNVPGDTR